MASWCALDWHAPAAAACRAWPHSAVMISSTIVSCGTSRDSHREVRLAHRPDSAHRSALAASRPGSVGLQQRTVVPRRLMRRISTSTVGLAARSRCPWRAIARAGLRIHERAAAGRQHLRPALQQPRDHARLAGAEIRLAVGREDIRDRHAGGLLDLGIGIDERNAEPRRPAAGRPTICRPPSCRPARSSALPEAAAYPAPVGMCVALQRPSACGGGVGIAVRRSRLRRMVDIPASLSKLSVAAYRPDNSAQLRICPFSMPASPSTSEPMPSLFRFLVVVGLLGGIGLWRAFSRWRTSSNRSRARSP